MERDYDLYFDLMNKAVEEKYFYIAQYLHDNQDLKCLVDFGCGDGALLRRIAQGFPRINLIGIDKPEVVSLYLKNEHPDTNSNITFMTEEDFRKRDFMPEKMGVIFSSVLHELFSGLMYFDELEWLFGRAKVIFIRDMFFTDTGLMEHEVMEVLESDSVQNNPDFHQKFDKRFGHNHSITNKDMAEFLMKYPYKRNWENELRESYFSTPWHNINYYLAHDGFDIAYVRPHMNEFILNRTFAMGFNLYRYTTTTHIEIIFEKE